MNNEEPKKVVLLTLIAGRKLKDALLSSLAELGAHLTSTIYGRGTVKASYLQNILGLVPEENKVMISCVLTQNNAQEVLKMLVDQYNFHEPNTGIAFTIPVDQLSF